MSVADYRDAIRRTLTGYARIDEGQPLPAVETLLVFDTERDHYP